MLYVLVIFRRDQKKARMTIIMSYFVAFGNELD